MKIDDNTILGLADQLGISAGKETAKETLRNYEKKSDQELLRELLSLQEKLNAANVPYEKQMAAVEGLMPLMNEQQRARLNKIIGLLKK